MPLPNFELLDLRGLALIAERGSFQQAAAALHLSQPALSRRIQKLEATIGTPLFDRSTRTVRLTPAGDQVLPLVRRLLEDVDGSLLGAMASGERHARRITLASIPSIATRFFPAALRAFSAHSPATRVRILDLSSTECAAAVRNGAVEFAVALAATADADLTFEVLLTDRYGLVCRSDDPLASRPTIGWEDIGDRPLVIVHRGSGNRTVLEAGIAAAGQRPNWFYEVTRLTSALALVGAGVGASILPALACGGSEARDLVWRPIRGMDVARTIGILRRPGVALSPAAARLVSLLVDACRAA